MLFSTAARLADMLNSEKPTCDQYTIWIDGVGAWRLCLQNDLTIGGPGRKDHAADLQLMANLARKHFRISRVGEDYFINTEKDADAWLDERRIRQSTPLRNNQRILAGGNVKLGFSQPTALSASAVLQFQSVHRPAQSLDGLIMMHDTVLLGPGAENHIRCPDWPTSVVLFRRRNNELWCRSREQLAVDGMPLNESARVVPGAIVTGEDVSFRVEAVPL